MVRKQSLPGAKLVHRKLLAGIGLAVIFALNPHGRSSPVQGPATQPNPNRARETATTEPEQLMKAYGEAQPYMNCTLPELQRIVPALQGLKPDKGQLPLQSILRQTGEVIEAQLPNMPDLIAKESLAQADVRDAKSPGAGAFHSTGSRGLPQAGSLLQQYSLQFGMDEKQLEQGLHLTLVTETPWKDFDYLIVVHHANDGTSVLEESRTDVKSSNAKRLKREQKILHGTGFEYLWLLLGAANSAQSDYRLLGQQKMYGRETYVVGFAQSPARVKLPGQITLSGQTYPLLYQGIAWIDQSTSKMVRLRTDLLAPLPAIQLERFSADLRFEQVDISGLNLALWLPWQVELIWTQAGQMSGELHLYSKYSMSHASARILPPE
jgi:hypothetical protein